MERARWTDERLDERMAAIDHTFQRIDHSLRDLREEMRSMRSEMGAMRSDFTAEIRAINQRLTQIGFGLAGILAAGLITLVATQL